VIPPFGQRNAGNNGLSDDGSEHDCYYWTHNCSKKGRKGVQGVFHGITSSGDTIIVGFRSFSTFMVSPEEVIPSNLLKRLWEAEICLLFRFLDDYTSQVSRRWPFSVIFQKKG
jgi:hypothetical protein